MYDTFVDQVELKEGPYEVNLPFKDDEISVSDNYSLSEKRLSSLLNKLKNRPEVFSECDKIITEQLKGSYSTSIPCTCRLLVGFCCRHFHGP